MDSRYSRHKTSLGQDEAQDLGVAALSFIGDEPARLSRFLDLSGLGPHNLRAAAADPGFLAAVLDHLLADERLLIAFRDEREVPPDRVAAARAAMGGPRSEDE